MPRLRLRQYNERKPCYFCGAPGPSTREHAPPKRFFEGTQCSSITVPSCDLHNSAKSGADHAVKAALLRGVEELIARGIRTDVPDALRRSMDAMQDKYRQANALVTMQPFISDDPADEGLRLPFLHKDAQIESWVKTLTAALVWSVTGTNESGSDWDRAWLWSPSYYAGRLDVPLSTETFQAKIDKVIYTWRHLEEAGRWRSGWQPHPDPFPPALYRFDVCVEASKGTPTVIIRHSFFGSHLYFARFGTSEQTIGIMDEYLKAEADRLQSDGSPHSAGPTPPRRYPKR